MTGDSSFRMKIDGVFTIKGMGIVLTGTVHDGMVSVGDEIHFKGASGVSKAVVAGLETNHKQVTQAQAGDNIGVLLKEVEPKDFKRGDMLAGSDQEYSFYA